MSLSRRRLLAGAAIAGMSAVSGCGRSGSRSVVRSTTPDRVVFQTELGAFGRSGYGWVAKAKGFFTDEHLDVTVRPGAAGDVNLADLGSGRVQFTTIDYTGGLIRIASGQFDRFTMVLCMNTGTLIAVMSLLGRGISTPADLAGKTVIEPAGSVIGRLFPAYARLANFDPGKVRWVNGNGDTIPDILASGAVPAAGVFVTGAPSIAAAARRDVKDVVVLPYSDYLGDLYGNVLVTTRDLARRRPDVVARFTRALFKGLVYCGAHPAESAGLLRRQVPTVVEATAAAEMTALAPYISTTGRFDPARVARGFALLQAEGLTTSMPDADAGYLTPGMV